MDKLDALSRSDSLNEFRVTMRVLGNLWTKVIYLNVFRAILIQIYSIRFSRDYEFEDFFGLNRMV